MPIPKLQLGAIDRSKSVAAVRAAALGIDPLDERVQAAQNLPILIAQFNIEADHHNRIAGEVAKADTATRATLTPKLDELRQRLEAISLRLGGLRSTLAQDVRDAHAAGYLTDDEVLSVFPSSGLGIVLTPLVILAIAAGIAAVLVALGSVTKAQVTAVRATGDSVARAKGLREWIDNELERARVADATGSDYVPLPVPPVLTAPGDGFDVGDAAAGFGVGALVVGALALFILAPKRRS